MSRDLGLTFTPTGHRYTLDGVVVPSVTGILKAAGVVDFSRLPPPILEQARLRGQVVHQAVALLNEGDLDVDQFMIDFPLYRGYLEAWALFCRSRHFVPLLTEYCVASRIHQIAGTLDCLGTLDGVGILLDFKTGRPQDVAADLQTAAYHGLAREWAKDDPVLAKFFEKFPLVRRYAVQLKRDGTFGLEPYDAPGDYREFLTLAHAQQIIAKRQGREWAAFTESAA